MLRFSAALVKAIEPVSGRYNCSDSRAASAGPSPAAVLFSSFHIERQTDGSPIF